MDHGPMSTDEASARLLEWWRARSGA
jgi:hypothetical protein